MKNLKSLRTLALAGVAIAITTGCSSTQMGSTGDSTAAYRFATAAGPTPITDSRMLGMFPLEWNPVAYQNYRFQVPVANSQELAANTSLPEFNENLQPGDAFVEAAGAQSEVKRVIVYTPFAGSSLR